MIFKDEIFELDQRQYVLLGVQGEGELQDAIYIDLHAKKVFPEVKPMWWLLEKATRIDQGAYKTVLGAARESASKASKRLADERWTLIKDIVKDPDIYREGARWALVQQQAAKMKCSANRILAALRLWWQGGQTRDALLGYRPRSKPAPEQASESDAPAKPCMRGRPATKPGSVNFHATALDHQNYKDVIDTYYLTNARLGVSDAYAELLARHYRYRDGNGDFYLRPAGERPTLRQFSSYLKKHYSLEFKLRSRKGDKAFAREHRAVLGTTDADCHRPGQIYELDSTTADATIVSSDGRNDIIGRPTLFIIIDRYSRMIVGWYIGLEKPCWDAVLQALFSIAEDKRALCQRLGIDYDPSDWIAQGIMCEQFLVDRGEVIDKRAASVALVSTISYLPACRPDWKPNVEGSFKLTHAAIKDAPGYNPASNAVKRRSVDYSAQAALTLEEFEKIIVRWFIAHNRTVRKHHQFTSEQYRDQVEPTPLNLFAHGLRMQSGAMRRFTEAELKRALLPSAEATIDEHGIWVNEMCYQPEGGEHPEWFVEGRRSVGDVKVFYDRRRVDKIYVRDPRAHEGHFLAKLARHSVRYMGMSLAQAEWMRKGEQELLANGEHSVQEERAHYRDFVRPIMDKAQRETKVATKGASKASRRANSTQARAAELDRERDRNVPASQNVAPPAPAPAQATAAPAATTSNVVPLAAAALAQRTRLQLFNADRL